MGAIVPIRKQTHSDGITTETQVSIVNPSEKREIAEFIRHAEGLLEVSTFDGRVRHTEQYLRRLLKDASTTKRYRKLSRPWYAAEILAGFEAVRQWLARKEPSAAASEALRVGFLLGEARAKWSFGTRLLGRARLKKNRELSRRARQSRKVSADERADEIRPAVLDYTQKNPGQTERTMAAYLARAHFEPLGTMRTRIDRLKKKDPAVAKAIVRMRAGTQQNG
jgi:hypothetical protein